MLGEREVEDMARHAAIVEIAGVGKRTAKALAEHGIDTVEAVAEAPLDKLDEILGIGAERATSFKVAATRLLVSDAVVEEESKRLKERDRKAKKSRKKRKHKKKKADKKSRKAKKK